METLVRRLLFILLLTPFFLTESCLFSPTTEPQILRIDGSSTVFTITEAIAEEYIRENPDKRLTIGISGTGGGFRKFARGEILIANASRPIKAIEAAECASSGIEYLEIAIAYDGLAVIANPKNEWLDQITVSELKLIWEPEAQQHTKYWDDVRPAFPHHRLQLYGPGTASGTFDYFTEVIVGKAGSSRGDFMPSEDDHVLIQGVSGDLYSLGFVGLAYYEENSQRVKLIPVNNGKGAIAPSRETINAGLYQPLTRKMYLYISREITKVKHGSDFIRYFLKNVPLLSEQVGFVALTAEEYTVQLKRFENFIQTN